MATVEQLKKIHGDALHAIQQAEQQQEALEREYHAAIRTGADDSALDEIETRRRLAARNTERRRIAEQQAHAAVTEAEQAEQAKRKKLAADAFLRVHAAMQAQLEAVEEAAQQYREAVAKLEAAQAGYFDSAVAAQQVGAKPAVTSLRMTTDMIGVAKRAGGIPATLNARFN